MDKSKKMRLAPWLIFLAAFFDGLMALLLVYTYVLLKIRQTGMKSEILSTRDIVSYSNRAVMRR